MQNNPLVSGNKTKKTKLVWTPKQTTRQCTCLAVREAFFKPPKKLRGGQPLNWLHTIKKDFKTIELSVEEAIKLSENRKGYKDAIDCLMAKSQTNLDC